MEKSLSNKISEIIIKALEKTEILLPLFENTGNIVERPKISNAGSYSTSIAMKAGKILNKKPMEIAELIKEKIELLKCPEVSKIEIVEPGFVNFFISKQVLEDNLREIINKKDSFGKNKLGKSKTVVIDYSSPNIAKPFSVGHLRSTIIGQALCNIYRFLGYKVVADNHIGDWGTQFGKLIFAIKNWGDAEKTKKNPIKELNALYVRFHEEAEKNSGLDEQARIWFKKLENGNKEALKIWKQCVKWSMDEFKRVYNLLGVEFDIVLGESFYRDKTDKIIKQALEKKTAQESQGALIIPFFGNIPPLLIKKSDGATLYSTRDLAAIKYRLNKFKPFKIIYETGSDQVLYFRQLFLAAEILGLESKKSFFHVAHGLTRFESGKMSTRRGEVILLDDVLNEAVLRSRKIVEEKNPGLPELEKEKISKIVGIGAVKYNDLHQYYARDIVFDWGKVLNLNGSSGPYLQYAYARAKSILIKSEYRPKSKDVKIDFLKQEKEISLVENLFYFPEIIEESSEKFSPNIICEYLFKLTQEFNNFYESLPVMKEKDKTIRQSRLALVFAFSQVLKNGLNLLGIEVLERL